MEQSFIANINKVAQELDKLISINSNIDNISLTPVEVEDIITVKNQLSNILLVPQKEESVSLKHEQVLQKATEITAKYENILSVQSQVNSEHEEVLQKHSEVVNLANDVTTKSNEVKNLSVQIQLLDETENASSNYNPSTGVLTLGVPRGLTGKQGDAFRINAYGTEATKSMYDNAVASTSFFALDSTKLYFKISDSTGDWSQGIEFGKGAKGDDLTIVSIDDNADGSFTWHFSDGTDYITPSLKGNKGDTGLAPEHELVGATSIRFRNPDGSWGMTINLGTLLGEDLDMNFVLNLTGAI